MKSKKTILVTIILLPFLLVSCQNNQQIEGFKAKLIEKDIQINELNEKIETLGNFNKFYLNGLEYYYGALESKYLAEDNYERFSFNWDNNYLISSIDTCKVARDHYSMSNSKYQNAISSFEEAKKYGSNKIIDYYINTSNVAIDMQWAMYEACEYFESSAQSYLNGDKKNGESELGRANEKIMLHDSFVRDYNRYISKINILIE